MSEYKYKELTPYRGFYITKSFLEDRTGRIIKSTIIYDAVDEDDALLGAKPTLSEIKKVIDNYLR